MSNSHRHLARHRLCTNAVSLLLLVWAVNTATATDRVLNLQAPDSTVDLAASFSLVGLELAMTEQTAGAASTSLTGQMNVATTADQVSFSTTSAWEATLAPKSVSPLPEGEEGAAPGSLGLRLNIQDPVEIPDLPEFEGIDFGVLESAQADVAVRDIQVQIPPVTGLPLDGTSFNPTAVAMTVAGNVDYRGRFTLRPGNTVSYGAALLALQRQAEDLPQIKSITGSCSALELLFGCNSRRITIDVAGRMPLEESLVSSALDGHVGKTDQAANMSLPIDVLLEVEVVEDLVYFDLGLTGRVQASSDVLDIDGNGQLEVGDIDMLTRLSSQADSNLMFDIDADGDVDDSDRTEWLSRTQTRSGDVDLNGRVEFRDFLALTANYGQSGGWAQGDFDGNGVVEFPDFLALTANFNTTATAAAVPEPHSHTTLMLAAISLAVALQHRRNDGAADAV